MIAIELITDTIRNFLTQQIIPNISHRRTVFFAEHNITNGVDYVLNTSIKHRTLIEGKYLNLTKVSIEEEFIKSFKSLIFNSPAWKEQQIDKPQEEYVWILSVHTPLFDNNIISIALEHFTEGIVLGMVWESNAGCLFIGEKAFEGCCFIDPNFVQTEITISDTSIENLKSLTYVLPDYTELPEELKEKSAYRKYLFNDKLPIAKLMHSNSGNSKWITNVKSVPAQIMNLAKNSTGFVFASEFDYIDVAAAIFIYEHSGGRVTDLDGNKTNVLNGTKLFCSNKLLHTQFMKLAEKP